MFLVSSSIVFCDSDDDCEDTEYCNDDDDNPGTQSVCTKSKAMFILSNYKSHNDCNCFNVMDLQV